MVQQTTTTNPTYTTTTASSCPNMLPCGVCRLLMANCPRQMITYPTWTMCSPDNKTLCVNESEGK